MAVRVFHRDRPTQTMPMIASDARLVVGPAVGAWDANMNYVAMQPGEENVPHNHPDSEDAVFVVEGRGTVQDFTHDTVLEFEEGQVIYVPPGVQHATRSDRGVPVVTVGGPCPADVPMLRSMGAELPDRP